MSYSVAPLRDNRPRLAHSLCYSQRSLGATSGMWILVSGLGRAFPLFCLLLFGVLGEIFFSQLKSFNSCVPRFLRFFKSRFFTSLLLRFSGEVDVLSQVV